MLIFIPKKIEVGYQERKDTYSGKLAYVIYYDEKDKLRKEPSWSRWRNNEINPNTFKNVPTEGFVLNKKVWDYSGSWGNQRQAYTRIYDPRGFEFEIEIENLLYILENSNCLKGKGLEGEFVYSRDGKELVLLPVGCKEYRDCVEYTEAQSTKVTKNDMVEGCINKMRYMTNVIYLGRNFWFKK